MHIEFPCGDLRLEGDLVTLPGASRAAVICHPHPQYGGDMDSNVVMAVGAALHACGCATLRFNFRGVGASTGQHGGGVGELDDVRAAAQAVMRQTNLTRLTLAGYSFGALMALRAGAAMVEVDRLIAVAPPLAFGGLGSLAGGAQDILAVVGDRDAFCSVARLEAELTSLDARHTVRVLNGADHFFVAYEAELRDAVRDWHRP
jgi:alpha/beta superfamily hydrolase